MTNTKTNTNTNTILPHAPASGEGDLTNTIRKIQLETFVESNPSTPSPSKISKTSEFFYHAAYLVKVWSQNAKPLFEVEARW